MLGSGTQIGKIIRAAAAMTTVAGLTGGTGMQAGVVPWTMDEMRTAFVFSGWVLGAGLVPSFHGLGPGAHGIWRSASAHFLTNTRCCEK